MGLFSWLKKNKTEEVVEQGGQDKFLKDAPAENVEYSIPKSRKPVVVAKEEKEIAAKKAEPKAEEKKPAPKKAEPKVEEKKPDSNQTEPKSDEPVTTATEAIEVEAVDTVDEGKPMRNGTFDIKRTKDGRFVFNLYSANKVIIATSQIYSSSQSAKTGVKSVMTNAVKSPIEDSTLKTPNPQPFPKWEIYEDKAGEFRFRLYATNGSCICHAKAGYATKSNCKRGIESIIRLAADAQIDKSYLK